MNLEKTINAVLSQVADPLLGLTAQQLAIKPIISQEKTQLTVNLCAGFPSLFLKELITLITMALETAFPTYQIQVTATHFIKAHQTQLPGKGLRGVKNTIAIASGKGGVGKSTVTVNLAAALARAGARVGILDADIYGPSIPSMLGKTPPVEVHGEHYLPVMAHGIQAMSIGFLTQGETALIWRGPMLAKSLLQLINITQWDELDYLLIDLPPGTGDIQLSLVQKIPLTGAVIVTTPQHIATQDAEKALQLFEKTNIHVLGLIENMSQHVCSQCGHQEDIFGHGGAQQLAHTHQCTLLGQLPLNSLIRNQCDQGTPTALHGTSELATAFLNIALRTAIELAKMPLNYAGKFPDIKVES